MCLHQAVEVVVLVCAFEIQRCTRKLTHASMKFTQEATRDAKTSDKIMAQAEAMKAKAREAESIKAKEAKKTERAERERSVFVDD